MNLGAIRDQVKLLYHENMTDLDDMIDGLINTEYRRYASRKPWRQLLVENASFSTVAGTEFYALPANFNRMVETSVLYDVTELWNGTPLRFVTPDTAGLYKGLQSQTILRPLVFCISHASTGPNKRIQLLPVFTENDKTVQYDYWKKPSVLTADGDTPEVEELTDSIIYGALAQLARYFNADRATVDDYRRDAEDCYKTAFANIANLS